MIERKLQLLVDPFKQALGDSEKEKFPFDRKRGSGGAAICHDSGGGKHKRAVGESTKDTCGIEPKF